MRSRHKGSFSGQVLKSFPIPSDSSRSLANAKLLLPINLRLQTVAIDALNGSKLQEKPDEQ